MNAIATYQSLWRGAVPVRPPVTGQRRLTQAVVDKVLAEVCEGTDVRPREILGRGANRTHVIPLRQEAMYRLREITDEAGQPLYSYPSIGKRLNRDHSSVITAVKRHTERLQGLETAGMVLGGGE